MAVLQQHPGALVDGLADGVLGERTLALTQRDGVQLLGGVETADREKE